VKRSFTSHISANHNGDHDALKELGHTMIRTVLSD
jgi:hypothetical protein